MAGGNPSPGAALAVHPLIKVRLAADNLGMGSSEKRRDHRLLCAGLVRVRWTGADGRAVSTIANLDDLSRRGVSLLLECAIARGTRVELSYRDLEASGEVRYSKPTDLGWIAGVVFDAGSQWDPVACPPEHLLDPKSIPADTQTGKGVALSRKVRSPVSCMTLDDAVRHGSQ